MPLDYCSRGEYLVDTQLLYVVLFGVAARLLMSDSSARCPQWQSHLSKMSTSLCGLTVLDIVEFWNKTFQIISAEGHCALALSRDWKSALKHSEEPLSSHVAVMDCEQ